MEFEEWLRGVPAAALKEFAGGGLDLRSVPKADVLLLVLGDPESRAEAEESWRIEGAARAAVEAMGPEERRRGQFRLGFGQ